VPAELAADRLLRDLRALCAIRGTAARPEELVLAAERCAELMRAAGLEVQLVALEEGQPPLVIGHGSGRKPATLLLYHHYDVAPSGPWRGWHSDPFELAEREGQLFGRGVALGKGPLVAHLTALAALREREGGLPCNVLVVAEGQALSGSTGLASAGPYLRQPDLCLASVGEADVHGRPFCYSGAKGLLQVRLGVRGATQPLPGGLAASVRNPLWRLCWALCSIKTPDEALQVEGIESEVEPLSREESQAIRAAALDEAGRLAAWNLESYLFEMQGAGLLRAEASLPACNLSQLSSEPAGDFQGIPVSAVAQLEFFLVPYQQPATVLAAIRAHLDTFGFEDLLLEERPGSFPATRTAIDAPMSRAVAACGTEVYGAELPQLPMGYFALPLALLSTGGATPIASVGCVGPEAGSVGLNESVELERLLRHGQLLTKLLRHMGE
jgi:acetylornithine deacetylase/succinyl-diaminopimelate desuccinylase-like protein